MTGIHPNKAPARCDPGSTAAAILRTHWDQKLPIRVDLIARRMGVCLRPLPELSFSGQFLAELDPQNLTGAPAIVFNTSDSAARQRFAIAHALGHFALNHGTSPRDGSDTFDSPAGSPPERAANQFAAHLLMPANVIRMMISQGQSTTLSLSTVFGVPTAAMARQLIGLCLR